MSNSTGCASATTSGIAPDFPARAIAQIRELHSCVEVFKTTVADAERALALSIKNREIIELKGENPDDVVRSKRAALDLAKRELAQAKNELMRAFIAEGKRCAEIRAEAWTLAYGEIIQPQAEKIAAAQGLLERAANEIIALLKPDSETMRKLKKIDEATAAWNHVVSELHGPGNAAVNITPATQAIFASFIKIVRFRDFETALSRLRDVLDPRPAPVRVTEESLAAERERAADKAHVLSIENERRELSEAALIQESERRRLLGANKV